MGIIRILLAIAVVAQHTMGVLYMTGAHAVEIFFVISGFLMSYILIEAKSYATNVAFWTNRILRLWPLYMFVATVTFIIQIYLQVFAGGQSPFFSVFLKTPFLGQILLSFSNIFILGQDVVLFLDVREGALVLKNSFENFHVPLHWALLVPPAWTLALELMFYFIAPFVLKSKTKLAITFGVSVGVRIAIYSLGLAADPWLYRFFPAELSFFLVGAISHRAFFKLSKRLQVEKFGKMAFAIVSLIVALIIVGFGSNLLAASQYPSETMALLMAMCLPGIFTFQNLFKWDRIIGEYSYPLYVWHLILFQTFNIFTGYVFSPVILFIATLLLGLIASKLTNKYLDSKFQTIRIANKTKKT